MVRIPSWVVVRDGQLHRVISSVEVDAFDVQDRLAWLAIYERRELRRSKRGSDVLANPFDSEIDAGYDERDPLEKSAHVQDRHLVGGQPETPGGFHIHPRRRGV